MREEQLTLAMLRDVLMAGSGRKPYARVSTDTRLTKPSSYALLAVISANSRARLAALRAAFVSS